MAIEAKTKTVEDVYYQVTRTFGDEAAIQINDRDIISFVNRAQNEVVLANYEINRASYKGTLTEGQTELAMGSIPDLLRVHMLTVNKILTSALPLEQALKKISDNGGEETGQVRNWYMFDNTIRFVEIPDKESTFEIFYNRIPAQVTKRASSLDVPDSCFNLIVNWVLKFCYELDDDIQNAQARNGEIERDNQALRLDVRAQHGVSYSIRDVTGVY